MQVSLDKTSVPASDPVTLAIVVSGEATSRPCRAQGHDPTRDQHLQRDLQPGPPAHCRQGTGSKTFSVILVPREAGNFQVGPILMDYFDPTSRSTSA